MLTIATRFNGPPHSGNGGYVAGLLARRYFDFFEDVPDFAKIEVTLRKPPPLETGLAVKRLPDSSTLRLTHGNLLIAEADAVEFDPADDPGPVAGVGHDEAVTASRNHPGGTGGDHPFLTCFVCGPAHPTGLHVFPGAVDGLDRTVAAPWTPREGEVGEEFVWAALDCPGGWSPGDLSVRPMVLGRMSARVDRPPEAGAPHVVMGRHVRTEGRTSFTESALYGPDGELVARAEAVWIAVDPATVRPDGFIAPGP